jgi:phage terminase large subunit|tara:strand:+ start:1761 stop:2927 length:1167 start_codon:yes stop_codon:yes gene_type:complete
MLVRTTAINKILALNKRIKIIQGGTSAGKTFGILPVLIHKACDEANLEISVVAESIPHLRRGALRDFIKIMKWTNRFVDDRYNKSHLRYDFSNGSFIEFFSADDPSRLRGARRDILYINECNNVVFDAYNELSIRTKREVYLDFNPANEFWVHTELKHETDADFIILTYRDNEALDEGIVAQIEKNRLKAKTSTYWANWWKVYGEGKIGSLQGAVFTNYKLIDRVPEEARLIGIGLDFGYSADPTAIIEVYRYNDKRILNERAYQTQMLNSDIARELPTDVLIVADSAEPKSIEEIRRHKHGILIKGATKGRDSISYGIDVMQRQEYLVTKSSTNLIKELRSYCWDTDKTGKRLNKPIDKYNHALDAVRYHEMETLGLNENYGTYSIM